MRLIDCCSQDELRSRKLPDEAQDVIEFLRRLQDEAYAMGYPAGEALLMFNSGMGLTWTTMDHEKEQDYVAFLDEFKEDKFRIIAPEWHKKLLANEPWYADYCRKADERREMTKYADIEGVAHVQEHQAENEPVHQPDHSAGGSRGY